MDQTLKARREADAEHAEDAEKTRKLKENNIADVANLKDVAEENLVVKLKKSTG